MKKTLVALAVWAVPSIAMAAPPTCYDLLVRDPQRTYHCEGILQPDLPFLYVLTFSPSWVGAPGMDMTFDSGFGAPTEMSCLCDSKGSASKPKFHASKSFTCMVGDVGDAAAIRGTVGGKDGDKITGFQLSQVSPFPPVVLGAIGSCKLVP